MTFCTYTDLIHKWINITTDSIDAARQQFYGTKETFINDIVETSSDDSACILHQTKDNLNGNIK